MTELVDDFLKHYGKKGMKWGVRKDIQRRSGAARSEYVEARDAKWVDKVTADPKISKVARIAARDAKRQTAKLKKDYKDRGLNVKKNGLDRTRYDAELATILKNSVDRASYKVHKSSPTGLKEVQIHRHPDGSMSATIGTRDNAKIRSQQRKIANADAKAAAEAKKRAGRSDTANLTRDIAVDTAKRTAQNMAWQAAGRAAAVGAIAGYTYLTQSDSDNDVLIHEEAPTAEDFDGLEFLLVLDDEGFVDDILTPFDDEGDEDLAQSDIEEQSDEFVAHYGIKGMKWGVRKKSSPRPSFMPPVKGSGKPKWQSPPPTKPSKPSPASRPGPVVVGKGKKAKVLSEDAAQFRELRMKVKREGLQSLNNKDIELINKRAEVMSKYNKSFPKQPSLTLKVANIAVDGILSDIGSQKLVDFVAGPMPRPAKKDKQAEVLTQLLTGARTVRKATKASKGK